jgi:uncharacterized OB-fold protein
MTTYNKPVPQPTATSAPFWQAAQREQLKLQYCSSCNNYQHFPRPVCGNCWSENIQWRQCSGKGQVYSYSVCHAPTLPSFKDQTPYVVAMVELEEGVRMTTNIIDCNPASVCIGMAVQAVFDHVTDACTLIKFGPINS